MSRRFLSASSEILTGTSEPPKEYGSLPYGFDMSGEVSIDILMGTYNGAEFLEQQIESLVTQTCSEWRLLVRDDGSTDATARILQAVSQAHPRIQIVSDELGRLGAGQNFHHLLGLSTAPYVMFCDQDDV